MGVTIPAGGGGMPFAGHDRTSIGNLCNFSHHIGITTKICTENNMTVTRFASSLMAGGRPSWLDQREFPFASHFIEIEGNQIHYIDEGNGPVLLFLPRRASLVVSVPQHHQTPARPVPM